MSAITQMINENVYVPKGWSRLYPSFLTDGGLRVSGSTPTQYKIIDTGSDIQFYDNGLIASGSPLIFTAADLAAGLVYYRGVVAGIDNLTIQVSSDNGLTYTNPTSFIAIVQATDTPYTISYTGLKANIEDNSSGGTALSRLLNFTGASAYDFVRELQFYVVGSGGNGGYFTYSYYDGTGTLHSANTSAAPGVMVDLADFPLNNIFYHAGATGTSETLYINAFDNYTWSGWYSWNQISGSSANVAPVINKVATQQAYIPNGWTALSPSFLSNGNFVVTDASTNLTYSIVDNGTHLQFYDGGLIKSGSTFTFTASDLAAGKVYYRGLTAGTDQVSIQVFDGQDWSAVNNFNYVVRASDTPFTVSSANSTAWGITPLTTLVRFNNATQDAVQELQFYDSAINSDGGYFTYVDAAGTTQQVASGRMVYLNSQSQIASLQYVSSTSDGVSETAYFNAYDGYTWSGWNGVTLTSGHGSTNPVPQPSPTIAPNPFTLKAVAGVASWKITFTITPATGAAYTMTQIVNQDSGSTIIGSNINNANITFNPNINAGPGTSVSITAQGYGSANATGTLVASSAQLSMTSGFGFGSSSTTSSSINFKSIGLDNAGNLTGLPTSYSASDKTLYGIDASNGKSYSLDSLTQAFTNSSVLLQYAANGQVAVDMLEGVVSSVGYNNMVEPSITVNGVTIPILPGSNTVDAWGGMALKAPVTQATTVLVWTSGDGGAHFYQSGSLTLKPSQTTQSLNMGNLFQSWSATGSSVISQKVYFTDANGATIPGLQLATLPAAGKILTSTDWHYVDSYVSPASTLITYTGTVAQILSALNGAPASSLFYIVDTTANITAAGSQLYNLVVGGKLVGATPTDGFSQIMGGMSSDTGATYLTISDGSGHTAYIRADQHESAMSGSSHQQAHSVLAIKTSTSATVNVVVDGAIVSTLTGVNGTIGYSLPADLTNGLHTIALTASAGTAQIGVVPPGGGFPSTYATSISVWVGTAAQLPTGVGDIVANTLYVVSDTAANIVAMDSGVSVATGVIVQLANSGYLAYSTPSMSWTQFQQLVEAANIPIANASPLTITDSAYVIGSHFYSPGANIAFGIKDTMARLLSPQIAQAAKLISQGNAETILWDGLQNAVDNHKVTWSDSLSTVLNSQNLAQMGATYFGSGKLASVQVHDTIFDLAQLSNATQAANLVSFVNSNTTGGLVLDVRDTIANVNATLTGSGAAAFEQKLATVFSGVNQISTRVEVQDSIANLKAAYDAGQLATLSSAASSLFSSANGAATNTGLYLRVIDTVANITSFLNNNTYNNLMSKVTSFTVLDTAANIINGLTNSDNSWDSATTSANNIIVKDSYANVVANATILFSQQNNSSEVTKVIFTDVTGANASSPLIISANYSYNGGQLPQFDFSQAKGLQGVLTVSEATLTQAAANAQGASAGVALTIADSNGHQVVIDVLSNNGSNGYNPDPGQLDLNNVILPSAPKVVPSIYPAPTAIPTIDSQPIVIQGNSAVAKWSFTATHYSAAGAVLSTNIYSVNQDSSGANIAFGPNFGGPGDKLNPGDYYSFSAVGLNANGAQVATGQLGFNKPNPSFSTSFYIDFASIDANGNVVNAPFAYASNIVTLLSSNLGVGDNYSISLDALGTALANNANLAQYAANYQLGPLGLANYVRPAGINAAHPWVSINGQSMWNAGSGLAPWDPMGIKWATSSGATSSVNVVQHITSTNSSGAQSTSIQSVYLNANAPINLDQWSWGLSNGIYNGTLQTIQIYFTDSNGNAINGLQVAALPDATGGMLTSSNWLNVGSGSSTPLTIYSGTVAQILAVNSTSANTVLYIADTIEHIQDASTANALYNLIASGKVMGSTLTDGFNGIAGMGTGDLSSTGVTNSLGQTAYIHQTESGTWYGTQAHSVLAIKASAAATVSVYIDGQLATTASPSASGVTGLVLPKAFMAALSNGNHAITLSATGGATVSLGVVPAGGGWPAAYTSSINLWTGTAAQLPTSLSDVAPNTLYVINDTAQNILALDGYAAVATEVLSTLTATGYLAYNSTTGMSWNQMHQLQQTNNNFEIANVSNVVITDSAYTLENHFYDSNAGQSFGIRDTMARLLNSNFILAENQLINATSGVNILGKGSLNSAFTNHQVNWVDNLATLNNTANLSEMAAAYYGSGQLASIDVRDTIANLSAITGSAGVANIVSFANTNASGTVMVDLQDTVANIYAALVGVNPATLEANLASYFAGAAYLSSRVQVNDSVANVEAYAAYVSAIQSAAASFFTNVNASANNIGLDFRITDTVAAINGLLSSGTYSTLASMVSSYIVVDSAQNIANAINNNDWATATNTANNIVVKDTFANVQAYAATLFSSNSGNNVEATKIIFTDISAANANNPLVINANYSWNGQMPQLDFTQAGLLTGAVTVTESVLSSSQVSNLVSTKGYGITGPAMYGTALTITDSASHQVIVDILSPSSPMADTNPDLANSDILSVYLNSANTESRVFNLTAGSLAFTNNGGGGPNNSNFESIFNFGVNDKISFSNAGSLTNLSVAANSAGATAGQANINSLGLATFNGSDTTLNQQIAAVEKAIGTSGVGAAAGHLAYWQNGADTYVLITDSHSGNLASTGDDLVKLVGVQSPSAHLSLVNGALVYH
jgi:hypothetical protein